MLRRGWGAVRPGQAPTRASQDPKILVLFIDTERGVPAGEPHLCPNSSARCTDRTLDY